MSLFTHKGILVSLLVLFMIPAVVWSQEAAENSKMSVADFYLDNQDMDANLEGTTVLDQNGEKCALIKIKTTQKGFSFDNGSLGVQKVDESKVAEVWVYIPKGSKRLTINNQNLGSIEYEFPTPINAARTYVMKLTTNDVRTLSFDTKHKGQLALRIAPPRL